MLNLDDFVDDSGEQQSLPARVASMRRNRREYTEESDGEMASETEESEEAFDDDELLLDDGR